MRTKTKIKIIIAVIIAIIITALVYFSLNHWYEQYGELGFYLGVGFYLALLFVIIYAALIAKYPWLRPRPRSREPYREDRIDVYHHHIDDSPRPPRRRPYQQDDRISPMFQKRAEEFSSHKRDVVDNYGYFGKKKKRR